MNEAATGEYHQTLIAIDKKIEALKDQIADYNQTHNNINWENVGDMKHILNQLQQLTTFI